MKTDLTEFEDWLLENGRAAKTIRNTIGDLERIQRSVPILSRDDFRKWIRQSRTAGMLNVTFNHYVRSINQYCTFMKWEKFPWAREAKNVVIKTVTEEQKAALFNAFEGYEGKRDRAIASLEFGCGLRIGEIWNLQLKDIAEDHLRVRGKNEKVRDVWLPAEVRKAVSDYLEIRLPTDSNYVFTSRKGRMSYEYIRQRMARVAARAGVRFHNHMARHTYATELLRQGISIYAVSKILGHQDLETTSIYAHLDQGEVIDEIKGKVKKRFFLAEAVKC